MAFVRGIIVLTLLLSFGFYSAEAGVVQSLATTTRAQKLRWNDHLIRISVSRSVLDGATNVKYGSDVEGALKRSFEAWEQVADISFVEEPSDELSLSPTGVAGDGVSLITIAATPENVLLFGKNDDSAAAKTRVFYNRRGVITEADIVLSPFQQFSTDGTFGTFDLQATLTHELGHLLGLRHSNVVGSIMYGNSSRNGVFGENSGSVNSLSDDDVAAIRDLYGAARNESCCGSISGRLSSSVKSSRGIDVWLREPISGNIVGHAVSAKDGSFAIGGLKSGTYAVQARDNGPAAEYSILDIGSVSVTKGETASISRRLPQRTRDFSVELIGKNGILADSSLRLEKGNTYMLYLGGRNLSSARLHIDSDSPFLVFDNSSLVEQPYDDGVSGMSFAVTVTDDAPSGSYSVCVGSGSGARDCFVGAIIVTDRTKP